MIIGGESPYATVAQLAEQCTRNAQAKGSSPFSSSIFLQRELNDTDKRSKN